MKYFMLKKRKPNTGISGTEVEKMKIIVNTVRTKLKW